MTQQIINTGLAANDGKGDNLRTAGIKINSNFTELYATKVPDFFGNANKVLSTNGTSLFWVPSIITNAIQTTTVYNDPTWIGSLAYSKLTGKPTIPTSVSQLTNDLGFITTTGLPSQTSNTGKYLTTDGVSLSWVAVNPGAGTVTQVSFTNANGFSGTVATSTTVPSITIGTSVTGILKGNGTVISAATAGTDYLASLPTASTSTLGGVKVDGTSVTINGSGVISVSAGLAGSVIFKGGWDASTNTPTLISGTGTAGWMYIVSVAGTRNLGGGSQTYAAGDLLVYDGINWINVVANSSGISSFNTRTGAITMTSSDVTTALGYTPYDSTNPSNYLTGITSSQVTTALGFAPLQTTSLSVTTNTASGNGSLTYSGNVFTFTPSAYILPTATPTVLGGVKIDNSTITISNGVIAVSNALTSAVQFKGSWDASSNTPALSTSAPSGVVAGWEYIVSAAGTRDLGAGTTTYTIGDLVIYDGSKWARIPGGNSVTAFNTRQGAITLNSSDVTTALASTTANYILAAPNGSAGTASFRAAVIADISNLGTGVATFLASPTSANLASAITDETGTSKVLFSTSPTVTTSLITDSASFNLLNTVATTVNFAGAATTLSIGAATGTASINNVTLTLGNATAINVNGISPTIASTSTGTLTLFNTNLLTVAAFNAATTVTLANSATSLGIGNTATASQVVNMFTASTGGPSTYNFATGVTVSGSTKSISIGTAGASGSTTNINIGSAVSGATSTLTVSGSLADATLTSTAKSVGYLGLPQSATATTATLAIGDAGKHIYVTTASQTITIPANGTVAYPIGTTITFIAGSSATTVLIAITTDTMRLAGGTSTGTRTLAANGMATAVKVAATTWYINGVGLT